ncbi:hypothetical protein SAMN02910292_00821 [Lachnospiraceae bacterium XBB2008]|nr:hypothetical protein SAMN02910292_00821 [Lachnospiraceae bacterium XBB2008]
MKKISNSVKLSLLFAALSAVVIIPVLVYAGHSFPVADDFYVENAMAEVLPSCRSYLLAALIWVYRYYMGFGGFYSDVFFSFALTPVSRWGITGLRVMNVSLFIVFFAASFFMIWSFVRRILRLEIHIAWFLWFVFLFALINNYDNSEIFTWYDVVSEYVFVSAIMMTGFGLLFMSLADGNRLYIPAAVCAFIASGAVLNLAILNCGIIFLFGIYAFLYWNKRKEMLTVFGAAFLGALINLTAPGNFVRHDSITSNYNLLGAVKHTIMYEGYLIDHKVFNTLFVILALVVTAVLYFKLDHDKIPLEKDLDAKRYDHPVLLIVLMGLGIFMINFPVHLGYNDPNLSGRAIFIQDLATYFMLFLWILYFIGWAKTHKKPLNMSAENKTVMTVVFVLAAIAVIRVQGGIRNFATGTMIVSSLNGDLEEYVRYEEDILNEIAGSPDDDVVLHRTGLRTMMYVKPCWLQDDTEFFINEWCAGFYGKDSVRMIYTGETE